MEVFNSLNLEEVRLAETLLQSENIMVTVSGETGTQVFGRVQGLTGGVSLMVPAMEEERAFGSFVRRGICPLRIRPTASIPWVRVGRIGAPPDNSGSSPG